MADQFDDIMEEEFDNNQIEKFFDHFEDGFWEVSSGVEIVTDEESEGVISDDEIT